MTMARLRLYALATVGAFFIVYELLTEAMSPSGPVTRRLCVDFHLHSYVRRGRMAHVAVAHASATRSVTRCRNHTLTGDAFSSLLASQPSMINSPWFPVLSMLSLLVGTGILAVALLIGSYPDGVVERVAESGPAMLLAGSLAPPLALLASPVARCPNGSRAASLFLTRTR